MYISTATTLPTPIDQSSGLSGGAIAAIVVAVAATLLVMVINIVMVTFIFRRNG